MVFHEEHGRRDGSARGRWRALAARCLVTATFLGGLALAAWLITRVGVPAIAAALHRAGWVGLFAICGVHLIAVTLMGIAWWRLRRAGSPLLYIWGRLVRDAGADLLSLSAVGGSVMGIRAMAIKGGQAAAVGAATLIDAVIEFAAQIVYAACGGIALLWIAPHSRLIAVPLLQVAVAAILVAGYLAPKPARCRAWLQRWPARPSPPFATIAAVRSACLGISRCQGSLWPSFALHLSAWFVSAAEAWLALRWMGARLDPASVLALEALVYTMRSAVFLVPGAIGIQEGAYVVAGAALGLPPDLALGLSLLKRARDVVLGIPALAAWHLLELRTAWRRQGPTAHGADWRTPYRG